jgi:phosphatidylserine/phosphatidylglycerophosphate/cardiolipin synthase-like enzyme
MGTGLWIQIGIGFTAALALVIWMRVAARRLGLLPSFTVLFSPKGGCQDALVREVKRARREILVQAYSFTSDPLTAALVEAKKRGVHIEVLLDRSNEVERYSELHVLLEHGLAPLIDANHSIAHNKIMIIDRKTLATGSFNFTHQAEVENAENLLLIKGHPDLLKAYRDNFAAHKAHCKPAQKMAAPQGHAPQGHAAAPRPQARAA